MPKISRHIVLTHAVGVQVCIRSMLFVPHKQHGRSPRSPPPPPAPFVLPLFHLPPLTLSSSSLPLSPQRSGPINTDTVRSTCREIVGSWKRGSRSCKLTCCRCPAFLRLPFDVRHCVFCMNGLTYVIDNIAIEMADLENMGLAVGIFPLSFLQADICAFPVWPPPSWIATSAYSGWY